MKRIIFVCALITTLLVGCVSAPTGPTAAVMPTPGKPFDVFQREDASCRNYAQNSTGINSDDANNNNAVRNATIGAALGAVVGGLIEGNSRGIAKGAAIGLVGGSIAGAENGAMAGNEIQRRYNIAYQQCMYAAGNQTLGYRTTPYEASPPSAAHPILPPKSAHHFPPPPPPPRKYP